MSAVISEAVARDPLTVVSAPSGFGKTTSVAEWASGLEHVAWLGLNAFDSDPSRLTQGVVNALIRGAERSGRRLDLDRDLDDPHRAYQEICRVLEDADERVHLIVDDAQRAGEDWRAGLLGMLAEQAPDSLRIVLVGTTLLEVTLSRHRVTHPDSFVGADTLSFTEEEVRLLLDGETDGLSAQTIFEETQGWPIAVRLMMIGGARPDQRAQSAAGFLGNYVREHVLATLPPEVADFVLEASVCSELTPALAAAVTGRPDAAALLETCVRLGLFLDRFEGPHGVVYRWHASFARRCAEILDIDAERAAGCHRRAAAALQATDPTASITHSLHASEFLTARETLLHHWLGLVVGARADEVECTAMLMLRRTPDDAQVLLVRACASDVLGDHRVARELFRRAEAMIGRSGDDDEPAVLQIARLFIADERAEVADASAKVQQMLLDADSTDLGDRAALNYLLGWTEIRHRGNPMVPLEYFSAAAREAQSSGDRELAKRALGHLAFGQTWAGHLIEARRSLIAVRGAEDVGLPWSTYAGGSAAAAAGYVSYWSGELDEAVREFGTVIANGGSDRSFTNVARMMIAYAAAESGDVSACRRAAIGIQEIPLEVVHGVSWPAFRESSVALLEEAVGRTDRAMRIARKYIQCPDLPVVNVALAGVLRRAGDYTTALEMLRAPRVFAEVSYVKSATLLTAALLRRQAGHHDQAHELCEAGVAVASGENIRLLFGPRETAVRKLLGEHVHFGTQFEDFIGRCLAKGSAGSLVDALSGRERDVFQQLQTARTLQEIARELAVSINTVKTHQRAIYRKLGVSSRREAVRTTV
ncbi:LuxR C-terminal-related transcriptional regulator [Microbacterium maritypicum]|uniref:LuxR C-terminal-related transcriptional regulator n=1 Tax=Microbacterium maritypicum TaxID=33918 RepID=UPI0026732B56|nr:LuxR C-terminal-related transcriptional regulator [Microbacterium liquefaciens]WKT89109.1 LuxR C-terminal-related transcriptional regulator [Microbacterium liquefaciens]